MQKQAIVHSEEARKEVLVEMHKQYLGALRQREQEIVKFIVILLPALGGFLWALKRQTSTITVDVPLLATSVGAVFLLTLGATYSLALGYNYRSVLFQLAKIESMLCLDRYIIKAWSRKKDISNRPTSLPEIIGVFFYGYIVAIFLVTGGTFAIQQNCVARCVSLIALAASMITLIIIHSNYQSKLNDLFSKDRDIDWDEDCEKHSVGADA